MRKTKNERKREKERGGEERGGWYALGE